MPEWFVEMLKFSGLGAFMFFTFYLYHKSSSEMFQSINSNLFALIKEITDQNFLHLTYLQKIDTKVTNNLWCPIVKKYTQGKEINIDE